MINKKNFIPTVCVVFTITLFSKILLEAVMHYEDHNYVMNTVSVLIFSFGGTFVLSLHNYMKEIPLLFVILIQYALLIAFVMLFVFAGSFIDPVSEGGYRDMFLSISIPYAICAVVYYICYFRQVANANKILKQIQKKEDTTHL